MEKQQHQKYVRAAEVRALGQEQEPRQRVSCGGAGVVEKQQHQKYVRAAEVRAVG